LLASRPGFAFNLKSMRPFDLPYVYKSPMKHIFCTILVFGFSLSSWGVDPVVNLKLLKARRTELSFPEYSVENKKLVIEQARLILGDVFVHRSLKIEQFGADIDPLPLFKALEDKVEAMDTSTFHKEMRSIFQLQRDLHTTYQLPYPYACYRSFIPLEFKEVIGFNGQKFVAISKITDSEDILKVLPDASILESVQAGDVLLEYNGMKIVDALKVLEADSGGANTSALRRIAVSNLAFFSHKYKVLPTQDEILLTLKNKHGKTYSVLFPIISKENETCLKDTRPAGTLKPVAEYDTRNEINKIFRQSKKIQNPNKILAPVWNIAGDPILKYRIMSNEYGKFGIFRLESFSPDTLDVDGLVKEFKRIMETTFAKTDGIIIDLRDNGGGQISLAENLVQLFNPKNTQSAGFRLRNSAANAHYVAGTLTPTNAFRVALDEATARGSYYTEPQLIDDVGSVNRLGQSYFRPVAIFNNASCYSSCDLFSALMQDHAGAVVFGEDPNTGAGGANNVQLVDVLKQLGKDHYGPFKNLPYGQNIGFAWRQMIRTGLHAGELIENVGVKADYLVEMKMSDLFNDNDDQFRVITKKLNEMSPSYTSSVKLKSELRQDLVTNTAPNLFASWEQTSSLVIKSEGTVVGEEAIELDNLQGRDISLGNSIDTSSFKIGNFEVLGMLDGRRVWRKIISYRVIPSTQALPEQGLAINFEFGAAPLTLYSSKLSEGWTVRNGVLAVGSGKYVDNVHTEASLFLELPAEKKKLSFDALIKTEKDYDFFQVIAIVDGKETALVPKMSGSIEMKSYESDLSAFAGKKIEIRFIFDSDAGVVDDGPQIDNLSIR
jgi:hypothetical protein